MERNIFIIIGFTSMGKLEYDANSTAYEIIYPFDKSSKNCLSPASYWCTEENEETIVGGMIMQVA